MLQLTRKQLAALQSQPTSSSLSKPAKAKKPKGGRLPRIPGEPGAWVFEARLNLQPRPKQRARHSAKGGTVRTYTPAETRVFEEGVRVACLAEMTRQGLQPLAGPLEVEMVLCLEGDDAFRPTAMRDGELDNLEKAVLDGMNHVVFPDDRFVVRKTSVKLCSLTPFIDIRVRPAG